ncbi:MAG: pilin [Patescibacteria group bacterium]|jgi:hypothetical protein
MGKGNQKTFLAILIVIFLLSIISILLPRPSLAAEYPSGWEIIPEACLGNQGKNDAPCDLNSFIQLFVNLAGIAIKVLPYIAMLMMIWAGFNLIMAGGNPTKIQEGKKMITSVLLGIIIVLFLAWAWANFVVFALTGSVNVFPGSIFSKEWWGGGNTNQIEPNAGCCPVAEHGCIEITEDECTNQYTSRYPGTKWRAGSCYPDDAAFCDKLKVGCCVPENLEDDICYTPGNNGCLDAPQTKWNTNQCGSVQQCDPLKIVGTPQPGNGCCVTPNNCSTQTFGACLGTYYSQNCSQIAECGQGCCVGNTACKAGKIDCDGAWQNVACSTLPGDCQAGCCIDNDPNNMDCFQSTFSACAGAAAAFFPGANCASDHAGTCALGCCLDTCTTGRMNDSCAPNMSYNNYVSGANGCGDTAGFTPPQAAGGCELGCGLANGASTCQRNVRKKDFPADHFWQDLACNAGAAKTACEEGCCIDTSNNYVCLDGFSHQGCIDRGGLFSLNTCGASPQCSTGGCCVSGGICTMQTSTQTRAYCENTGPGGTWYPQAECSSQGC